jgi:hypothetical protein
MANIDYRIQAAKCRADAELATLDNVRDRCLRAEAAWLDMAVRQERIVSTRAAREAVSERRLEPVPAES